MAALGHAVGALGLTALIVAALAYVRRPAPGAGLPPLRRPPAGSTRHVHRGSLPWCDAEVPPPPRWHRCWPHSGGWKRTPAGPAWYERCPCGAYREDEGRWRARNGYRHREDASVYIQPGGPLSPR